MTDLPHEAGKPLHLLDKEDGIYLTNTPIASLATGLLVFNA